MRIYDNGVYRDATQQETEALEQVGAQGVSEPTAEERLAALEAELAATKILLGLEE